MSSQSLNLITVAILCASFSVAYSIYCYECSSVLDDRCGRTWGYGNDKEAIEKIRKACNGTACKKLEQEDTHQNQLIVIRGCWNHTEKVDKEFLKCKDIMTNNKACYCTSEDDSKTCNGKQLLQPQIWLVVLGLLPFIFKALLR